MWRTAMSRCGKYSNHARNCIQMSMSIMESFCQYEISCAVLTRLWYRSHSFPVLDISCKSLSLSSRLPLSLSPILCLTSAASVKKCALRVCCNLQDLLDYIISIKDWHGFCQTSAFHDVANAAKVTLQEVKSSKSHNNFQLLILNNLRCLDEQSQIKCHL